MSDGQTPHQRKWSECQSGYSEHEFREELTEAQLIGCLDNFAVLSGGHQRDRDDFRNELTRRATERQTRWLVILTVVIAFLTVVLVVLTFALWRIEISR